MYPIQVQYVQKMQCKNHLLIWCWQKHHTEIYTGKCCTVLSIEDFLFVFLFQIMDAIKGTMTEIYNDLSKSTSGNTIAEVSPWDDFFQYFHKYLCHDLWHFVFFIMSIWILTVSVSVLSVFIVSYTISLFLFTHITVSLYRNIHF